MFGFFRNLRRVRNGRVTTNWFPKFMYGLMASMSLHLVTWNNLDRAVDRFDMRTNDPLDGETYDFIIVGAGTAGSLLASRLSENWNVLLLEAGGEPHIFQQIPMYSLFLLSYPEIDWMHKTIPQKYSTFAQVNNESLLSQGKGLGGTSNVNFLMHSRGHPKDFDSWAASTGDPSWTYDNVLEHFKKHEEYVSVWSENETNPLHGYNGEMRIQVPEFTGNAEDFLKAAEDMGYKRADLNGKYTEGFDFVHTPFYKGIRQGSYQAFLQPVRRRSALKIRKFSFVHKILMNGTDNEVYGVQYERHGQIFTARALKEVIISAGLNSPKLLMLSGIGDKENLESVGIEVKKHLPAVGRNIQDHTSTYLGPFFMNESRSLLIDRDVHSSNFSQYVRTGKGPFSSSGASAMGFLVSDQAKAKGEFDHPDIQLIYIHAAICDECPKFISHGFNLKRDVMETYYANARGKDSVMILASNGRPHSRGNMSLQSSNPYMQALIDPSYLDNEHDINVMIEAVEKSVNIMEKSATFQKYDTHFTTEKFPGCEDKEFRTRDYWECYIRHYTVSLHHIVGSCKMGLANSEESVVDSELRVIGTKRLRVIDAQVMPQIVVGNTNAPTLMIAEKGAAMIKKYWKDVEKENSTTTTTTTTTTEDSNRNSVDYDLNVNRVPPV